MARKKEKDKTDWAFDDWNNERLRLEVLRNSILPLQDIGCKPLEPSGWEKQLETEYAFVKKYKVIAIVGLAVLLVALAALMFFLFGRVLALVGELAVVCGPVVFTCVTLFIATRMFLSSRNNGW